LTEPVGSLLLNAGTGGAEPSDFPPPKVGTGAGLDAPPKFGTGGGIAFADAAGLSNMGTFGGGIIAGANCNPEPNKI